MKTAILTICMLAIAYVAYVLQTNERKRQEEFVTNSSQIIKQLSDQEFLSKLNRYLIEDNPNAMNFIRTQTSSLNKCSLKNIACCINDQLLQLQHHFKNFQWYQPTLDLSESNF